jgi:hypothetical protein
LETRDGESLTFSVDENTRFKIRGNEDAGLEDLEADMVAAVLAFQQEDGTLLAMRVLAGDQGALEGKAARGEITTVGTDSFTLENPGGETFTFLVNEETRFISRGSQIGGLADLETGMRAGVKYATLEDGQLVAEVVAVGQPHQNETP